MNTMATLPDRFCLQCNTKFKPYRPLKHKFCSGKCRLNYYLENKDRKIKAALETEIKGVFEGRIKELEAQLEARNSGLEEKAKGRTERAPRRNRRSAKEAQ
jgi:hypothetical protein